MSGSDFYTYVGNDPTDLTDPSGLRDRDEWCGRAICPERPTPNGQDDRKGSGDKKGKEDGSKHSNGSADFINTGPAGGGGGGQNASNNNLRCMLATAGNVLTEFSDMATKVSFGIEGVGAATTVYGAATRNPLLVDKGIGMMGFGGRVGLYAGGGQLAGNVLQWAGGGGYSNAVDTLATMAPSLMLSIGARRAMAVNPSVFQRRVNKAIDTADTISGTMYDGFVNLLGIRGTPASCN